ncbi:tartrate-resistant acid phosphatase type 5-like [Conger conger]|uniref:tartrate-resistant acid phosphatase type 5-like n=1 Tax=Conger conger TaxID=82655 RepID=UPI002A5A1541|nr:tartrate-resistant acid phosphatase type 5-like [Conger conger]XP_061080731.1 tartrate-resistant acid phosphatase type 5-like [Conger conger]
MFLHFLSLWPHIFPVVMCCPRSVMHRNLQDRNGTSIRFLAVGDWGGLPHPPYSTPVQQATARGMGRAAQDMGADFVLALGDNFYFTGVDSVEDPRFQETFERVFTARSLHVPWYVIAGNHDHHGDVRAQIAYSRVSERWHFPELYYELKFGVPGGPGPTLTVLMVDTVLLCGSSDDFADGGPRGPADAAGAGRQLRWLRRRMEASRADFLLVAGHYPVWSVAEHGPTRCLLEELRPLLVKHRATAYLSGHDHNLQYLEESGVGYVVSGAGNFVENSTRHWAHVPRGALRFFSGQSSPLGGFAHVEVTQERMVITFIQARGSSLYRASLPPRGINLFAAP